MSGYDPDKITFFAKTDARGQQIPFGIKAKDRQRHMYVIGKTGMGKSTLLENMAAQDIKNGEGMAFIDPHGSAIEVLLDYVPEERLDDVVYFAPFDMENPIAFNIMEDVGIDKRHLVVSGLMSTFKKIWVDAWSARMEYILTNALLALIEYPGTTLLSVNRMLADKAYRDKVVENIKDPAVKAYWVDEFASYTERFAAEALPAIQNKIGQFTGNPLIRNIIGQPKSSFDVRQMMDEKKILLINLSKGLVGETNADLLGSMLITKIYLAAMSRADLPPVEMKQMPNFYFYVDEFQSFANSTFANILSEARKYHLNLIIAHQYVAQMEDSIRDAVFGNVGTTVAFRTGPFDAEVLETVFAPQFEAVDLINLGMFQVCLTLMIDGVGSTPFSAVTLPPVPTPAVSHKHMVIKRSQKNYCRPRAEVEQAVIDSHSPDERLETAEEQGGGNKGGFSKPSAYFKVGTENGGNGKKHNNGTNKNRNGNGGNGNKNGNGNGGGGMNAGKTNASSNQNDRKPPQHKNPDDLRAILAQMSGVNATTNKAEVAEVKQPTKPNEKKETAAKEPPKQQQAKADTTKPRATDHSSEPRQNPKPAKTEPTNEQAVDDLRDVLKKMVAKTSDPTPKNTKPSITDQRRLVDNQPTKQTAPIKKKVDVSLQSALSEVLQKSKQPLADRPKATPNVSVTPEQKQSSPQNTTSVEVPSKAVTFKQSPEPAVGGVRQPAFEPVIDEGPSAATIKKMLRTSGKERPPGI